jgi:hypothetical protein
MILSIMEEWHSDTLPLVINSRCRYCRFVVSIPSTPDARAGRLSRRLCTGCWNRMNPKLTRYGYERRWHYDFRDRVMIAGCERVYGLLVEWLEQKEGRSS